MTKIDIADASIKKFFETADQHVYRWVDLKTILLNHRDEWALTHSTTTPQFIEFLLNRNLLRQVTLNSEEYRSETRFIRSTPSAYELGLSLKKHSYLSHATAVFLNSLGDEPANAIYVNHEQSSKPRNGVISQGSIDRAFKSQQRQSNYIFTYESKNIVVINGKHTGRLEVGNLPGPNGRTLPVTKIERTLIDIAVRPSYAGGPGQVLEAYKSAKNRLSIRTLILTLEKLDYMYPYHQSVGFYLERAGVDEKKLSEIDKIEKRIDFYAAYGMKNPEYSERWRLYYPKGL